jgi:hypothetical protein
MKVAKIELSVVTFYNSVEMVRKHKTPIRSRHEQAKCKAKSNGKRRIDWPEDSFGEFAAKRGLVRMAAESLRIQRERGLPIVFQMGSKIIKQFPSGKTRVLGLIAKRKYTLPAGVRTFSK